MPADKPGMSLKRKKQQEPIEEEESLPKRRLVFEKSAGAVVFYPSSPAKYLLLFSSFWEFPKGRLDPGETEIEAARREVREETGLEVDFVEGFRDISTYFKRSHETGALVKKTVVYYLARARTRKAKISWEHSEARWLTFDMALEQLTYGNSRQVLYKADSFLKNGNSLPEKT